MLPPLLACTVGMVVFFILLAFGLPIFITMGLGSIVGIFLSGNPQLLANVSAIAFHSGYAWSFVAIPLFVFMGFLVVHHKLGEDLFETVYRWIGHFPGGLGIASSLFSALFGFICGSGTAGVVTVGGVCLPEMLKKRYDLRFGLGTLATTGGLAALIPPSVLMILYCVLTEASIGKVFMAGIIPGLLLASLYSAYILVRAKLNPNLAPPGPKFSWKERFRSLPGLVSVVVIFIIVIGGLYLGIWTAIEAGGVACGAAFLICMAYRRVKWQTIKAACLDTIRTFGMLFMLQISANLMSFLFYVTGTSEFIKNSVLSLYLPGSTIIIFMWIIMFILGAPLEPPAILMICTPIFLPISNALGYDSVWFGIFMVLSCEVATLSPPIGMSIFAILRIAPEGTKLSDVYLGVTPYMILISGFVFLLIFFPQIVLWLPNAIGGG
jgi:C4-dicarboxylate transporter DctM subunit